jgi:SAM-dependent methyltransferase
MNTRKKFSRREKLLYKIDTQAYGLEIGPGFHPVLPKSRGYNVKILDTCSQQELADKFARDNLDVSKIEPVDYIWHGEPLPECIGDTHCFDFVIASHVIEHTPDFIGFLEDVTAILKETGILSLAVPDKRYCFDHFRPVTGLARVVDAHVEKRRIHTPGTGAEHFISYVSDKGRPGWNAHTQPRLQVNHSIADTKRLMRQIIDTQAYFDLHAWCFTPASFRFLATALAELDLIHLYVDTLFPTEEFEFFVTMSRTRPDTPFDRIALMTEMRREERDLTGLVKRSVGRLTRGWWR